MATSHRSITRSVFLGFVLSLFLNQASVYSAPPAIFSGPASSSNLSQEAPLAVETSSTPVSNHVTDSVPSTPSTIPFSPFVTPSSGLVGRSRSDSAPSPSPRVRSNSSTMTFAALNPVPITASPVKIPEPRKSVDPSVRSVREALSKNDEAYFHSFAPFDVLRDLDGRGRSPLVMAFLMDRYHIAYDMLTLVLPEILSLADSARKSFMLRELACSAINSKKPEAIMTVVEAIRACTTLQPKTFFTTKFMITCLQIVEGFELIKTMIEYGNASVSMDAWNAFLATEGFPITQSIVAALDTSARSSIDYMNAAMAAGRPDAAEMVAQIHQISA